MCLNAETVEALHAVASELKSSQGERDEWLKLYDDGKHDVEGGRDLTVTRAEAERIFAERIAALEVRLREQGWERKIRVESPLPGDQK